MRRAPAEGQNLCGAGSYKYSYTETPSTDGEEVDCYCSNDLDGTTWDKTGQDVKTCDPGQHSVSDVDSQYSYEQCYTTSSATWTWTSEDPDMCFDKCKYKPYMYSGRTEAGGWNCYCSDTAPDPTTESADCGGHDSYTVYYHVPQPEPSHDTANRKRNRERLLARQRQMTLALCPMAMVPCRVGGADAYECIDIAVELGELSSSLMTFSHSQLRKWQNHVVVACLASIPTISLPLPRTPRRVKSECGKSCLTEEVLVVTC